MKLVITIKLSDVQKNEMAKIQKINKHAFDVPYYTYSDYLICNLINISDNTFKQLITFVSEFNIENTTIISNLSDKFNTELLESLPDINYIVLPDRNYLPIEQPLFSFDSIIHYEEKDITKYAEQILEKGYAVIPLLNKDELKYYHNEMKSEMKKFPEYKNPNDDTIYVFGGFGALGNPAAFHNPVVRSLRIRIMPLITLLTSDLNRLEDKPNRKLEEIIDRLSLRRKGTSTTPEAWHKDQAALPTPEDDVFGGWINLDISEDQYFSGVPETHKETKGKSGFARLTEDQMDYAKEHKNRITIPPGNIFIFYQNLTHEVVSRKMPYNSLRLYTGFRLTELDASLFSNENKQYFDNKLFNMGFDISKFSWKKILSDQGVPPLPSAQKPPMYAMNNLRYPDQRKKVVEWSQKTFKPECLEEKTYAGEELVVVERFMKSLKDYGFQLYPEYLDYEKYILEPNTRWTIPFYGKMIELSL